MSQVARAVLLKDGGPGEAHGGRPISRDRHTRPLNLQKAQGPTGPARPTYPPIVRRGSFRRRGRALEMANVAGN